MANESSLGARALPRLRLLLTEAARVATSIRFSSRNRQHIIATSLLGSVLEQAHGIGLALDQDNDTAAFILLRSAVEAHIDLYNIANDPEYAHSMHAALLDQQRRGIESAKKRGVSNPYLASLSHNQSVDAHFTWIQGELAVLKQRGIRPLTVKKRFKLANKLDLYEGPYAFLCGHTHNNLNVLENRHLVVHGDRIEVHFFQPPTDIDSQLIIDTIAGVVANSVATVKATIDGAPPTGLDDLSSKLAELRALWKQ